MHYLIRDKFIGLLKEKQMEIEGLLKGVDLRNKKESSRFINYRRTAEISECEEVIENCKIYLTKLDIKEKLEREIGEK